MASIVITIETDGAFRDGLLRKAEDRIEMSRVLRLMGDQYERCGMADPPRHIDGEVCGTVEVIE